MSLLLGALILLLYINKFTYLLVRKNKLLQFIFITFAWKLKIIIIFNKCINIFYQSNILSFVLVVSINYITFLFKTIK